MKSTGGPGRSLSANTAVSITSYVMAERWAGNSANPLALEGGARNPEYFPNPNTQGLVP